MTTPTLQQQGVPVPSKLNTRASRPKPAKATRPKATPPQRTIRSTAKQASDFNASYNPANVGEKASNSVGMLEAEFLVALGLLVMLMFSSSASFGDKMMSTMKRGALLCVAFFILSLIASGSENAAKFAKAFGALLVVAIVITSPVGTVITDFDNLIKNDWTGTSETGGTGSGNGDSSSSNSGTGQSTNGISGAISNAANNSSIENQQVTGAPGNSGLNGETGAVGSVVQQILGFLGL